MTKPEDRAARDLQALELRREGVSIPLIAERLKLSSALQAERAVGRALKAQGTVVDPAEVRALELDRLDQLQQAVWASAMDGDLKAVEQVQKLAGARVRLAGIAARGVSVMTDAFDASVAALATEPEDESILAAGRRIAERIDTVAAVRGESRGWRERVAVRGGSRGWRARVAVPRPGR